MQNRKINNESIERDDIHRNIIYDDETKNINNQYTSNEEDIEEAGGVIYNKYYHLSPIKGLTKLQPSVPSNFLTDYGFENSTINRVCFTPSIDQCLMAMSANITHKEFYVYIPYNIDTNKLRKPSVEEVPDSLITGEVWSLQSVRIKCIGKIRVTRPKGTTHNYNYGDKYTAELYEWEYEWVEKYLIDESTLMTKFKDNYKTNGNKKLSSFKKVVMDKKYIDAKKSMYPKLKHIRHNEELTATVGWEDKDNKLVALCSVSYASSDGYNWLTMIEVLNEYKGYGLGRQVLDYAVKNLKCNAIGVDKDNKVAYEMYKKAGFKVGKETNDNYLYMYLKPPVEVEVPKNSSYSFTFALNNEGALPEYDGLAGTLTTNDDIELELPNPEKANLPDLKTLLDNTDPKHIWLSSDWHFFKNHYKKEVNFVNTRDITQWCYKNLKDDDVFIYLGDISFRYANEEDQLKSQEILKKIPAGKKVLVLGNHDKMLGEDYFTGCGFDYVVEDIYWQNYLFTHKPVRMDTYPEDVINIHGHMHTNRDYNTSDGTRNVNIYPKFFDNKPVTLDYVSKHWKELSKDNYWNPNYGYGEAVHNITNSTVLKLVQEANAITQKPTVYFSNTVDSKTIAYMVSLFKNNVGSNTAIKIDFNNNALNSKLLKDLTKATNSAFVNSNYIKQITNASDHITAANTLGYDYSHIDILDNDGDIRLSIPQRYQIENELRELNNGKSEDESYVSRGIHLQDISVGSHIKNYDSLIVYTNFAIDKVSGYSGAIKNIGYGVASGKIGKLQIHGQNMQSGPILLERIVESAAAVSSLFTDRIIYINVLQSMGSNISNIGVLVSNDIVAIEQASIDFIRNAPKNKTFIEHIGARGGFHQIEYADWLRMGSKNYILRDLSNNRIKLENTVLNGITLYHGSKNNLNIIKPKNLSYNEDNYVFATPSKAFALIFAGNRWNDDMLNQSVYNGEMYITEKQKGAIKATFDTDGYIYTVPADTFIQYNNHKNEFISKTNVTPIDKIYIKNVLDELNKLGVIFTYYPNKPKWWNSVFNENILINRKDIEYRVNEFKDGDLNIALVVGFSGSGKSTLGRNLAKAIPNTDHYELDDLVCNWNFTDDNLKEYGDLIYSFFQGPGKKFRVSYDDLVKMRIQEKDYEIPLVEAFLKYAYTYSKSHKNRKNVIEGVWPLIYGYSPDTFKDWCVIIKGTSYLNSEIRATKRDVDNGKGLPYFKALVSNFLANNNPDRLKTIMKPMNANINIWYKYFKTPVNESVTYRDVKKLVDSFSKEDLLKFSPSGKFVDSPNCIYRNIVKSGKYGGFIEVYKMANSKSTGFITIAVQSEARGSNIGTRLVNTMIKYIDKNIVSKLIWRCEKDNDASNALAKKCGFKLKSESKNQNTYILELDKVMINEAATKRSELPDSAFGIPEDRKYPLDTEKHVRSAIKLFGHAEESKKKSLARRIKAAAKKYDITIPETTQCYKYLNEAVQEIVPDEIQTIVFDFGHVLVHTDLKAQLLANQDIPNELAEPIKDFVHTNFFYNEEDRNNLQMLDIPQAKQRYMQLAPDDIKPYVDAVFDAMRYNCNYYSYSKSLIALFRSRGCKLYYLSNWDRYAYDLQIKFFNDITNLFDGGIMSFQVNDRKPNDSIYHALINKYNIDPVRAMFFDDRRENIEAANRCGFNIYLFNNEETPKILLSNNYIKKSNLEDMNNYILLQDGDRLVNLPMSIVTYWYINENEHPEDVDSGAYYSTLDKCVTNKINEVNNNGGFKDNLYLTEYVFTSNLALDKENQSTEDHKLVRIGEINIFESGAYEWTIQMPLKLVGKELYPLKEYTSIAAINPVIGINKPFVVNTGEKKIGFMTDIESDKMLVINDDNTLEVVPTNEYTITDIYEFIGNEAYVDRLNKLYKNSSKVDNIYSILTGRELYTEDQLDFDTSFKKIDLDLIEQKMLSEFATLRDNIIEACGINTDIVRPVIEPLGKSAPSFVNKYNTLGDISIKEDFDGVYFYSDLTHKRSASVASVNLLTENMLKVIM